jgi:hypothetical protein
MRRAPALIGCLTIPLDHLERLVARGCSDSRVGCAGLFGGDNEADAARLPGEARRQPLGLFPRNASAEVVPHQRRLDGANNAVAGEARTDAAARVDAAEQRRARYDLRVIYPALTLCAPACWSAVSSGN